MSKPNGSLARRPRSTLGRDELFGERREDERLPKIWLIPAARSARIPRSLERAQGAGPPKRRPTGRRCWPSMPSIKDPDRSAQARRPPPGAEPQGAKALSRRSTTSPIPTPGSSAIAGMLMQGYNIQTAVSEGQVILAARASSDRFRRRPARADATARAGANLARVGVQDPISEVVADTGYWHTSSSASSRTRPSRCSSPAQRQVRSPRADATRGPSHERAAQNPQGKATYQRRQQIIEPVFAHQAHARDHPSAQTRQNSRGQAEIDLIATTHNLLKLYRHPQTA